MEQALTEAKRCLDCANPTCMEGCPVGINIPSFVKNIERGEILEAARVLKLTSALPAVCGRVCPQEKQCESRCMHLKMGHKPVAIGYLERFAADYERESGKFDSYFTERMPKSFHGTGDIYSAAAVGGVVSGMSIPDALALACDYTCECIRLTLEEENHNFYGVNFEQAIPYLVKRMGK